LLSSFFPFSPINQTLFGVYKISNNSHSSQTLNPYSRLGFTGKYKTWLAFAICYLPPRMWQQQFLKERKQKKIETV